ncbi:CRP-like cAMP-binding protein [Tenacibaculum skagerrakense]|uniref:CRP-like cAMP-binding protein n=1 Tax=Tenacibaculum skagerrakense TaxID=186571 RepID=A0A4R2NT92_9FLAO|nr:Crp/Fnr family transcriptional regulator [Tenacibaculum skagerrakense]TCP24704.1 CRP-like cAMP-binding protein [Tenacibaculum skagerrakense]
MIPTELLIDFNAELKEFQKEDIIFSENNSARNYYQIKSGIVKMNNYNDDGKEFIQGIFYKEQSFGEPPLFIDINYPANAVAIENSVLYILPKEKFFQLLKTHSDIHFNITKSLAKRLYYKAIIASEISSQEPSHRILRFFDYLKHDVHQSPEKFSLKIDYTRQQISDLLGLRVETVIRAIKQLEKQGEVKIVKRKVYR